MKKFLCILLVVVMVFALATSVFAATVPDEKPSEGSGGGTQPSGSNKTSGGSPSGSGSKGGASGEPSAQTGYDTIVLAGAAVVLTLGAGVCFVNVRKVNG